MRASLWRCWRSPDGRRVGPPISNYSVSIAFALLAAYVNVASKAFALKSCASDNLTYNWPAAPFSNGVMRCLARVLWDP